MVNFDTFKYSIFQNEVNLRDIVKIYDARPLLNASANKMKGGGFEACGHGKDYQNCTI